MNMTSYQQAVHNLEYLKLKQMMAHLNEVVDFGIHNQLSFLDTLVKLTSYEIDMREQNMIHSMVKVGAFPHLKELSDFDFSFQPSVNRAQIQDFTSLRFIEGNENIVFLGHFIPSSEVNIRCKDRAAFLVAHINELEE